MADKTRRSPSTVAVTSGRPPLEPGRPLNVPITPASALVPGGDTEYARDGHGGWTAFEQVVGDLEGGHAVSFASGMGAVSAVVDLVPRDGHVVVPHTVYSGTLGLLRERARRGFFTVESVDILNTEAVIQAAQGASMLWLESPTNPTLEVPDLERICAATSGHDTVVVVDNTFATPLRQQPLELGADLVVHSASKLLGGHSDLMLGVVVTRDEPARRTLARRRTRLGATPGALESFLATRGARTLSVRLDRAEQNSKILHQRLSEHRKVVYARYPGFGAVVSFEARGGAAAADKITRMSELIIHATSVGGVESTWERRRRHSAEPEGVPDGLIRLSVGIEDVEDLWADIAKTLETLD